MCPAPYRPAFSQPPFSFAPEHPPVALPDRDHVWQTQLLLAVIANRTKSPGSGSLPSFSSFHVFFSPKHQPLKPLGSLLLAGRVHSVGASKAASATRRRTGCCSWGVAWTQKASGPHCLPLVQTGSSAHYNSRHLLSAPYSSPSGNRTLFSLEIYSIPTLSPCAWM